MGCVSGKSAQVGTSDVNTSLPKLPNDTNEAGDVKETPQSDSKPTNEQEKDGDGQEPDTATNTNGSSTTDIGDTKSDETDDKESGIETDMSRQNTMSSDGQVDENADVSGRPIIGVAPTPDETGAERPPTNCTQITDPEIGPALGTNGNISPTKKDNSEVTDKNKSDSDNINSKAGETEENNNNDKKQSNKNDAADETKTDDITNKNAPEKQLMESGEPQGDEGQWEEDWNEGEDQGLGWEEDDWDEEWEDGAWEDGDNWEDNPNGEQTVQEGLQTKDKSNSSGAQDKTNDLPADPKLEEKTQSETMNSVTTIDRNVTSRASKRSTKSRHSARSRTSVKENEAVDKDSDVNNNLLDDKNPPNETIMGASRENNELTAEMVLARASALAEGDLKVEDVKDVIAMGEMMKVKEVQASQDMLDMLQKVGNWVSRENSAGTTDDDGEDDPVTRIRTLRDGMANALEMYKEMQKMKIYIQKLNEKIEMVAAEEGVDLDAESDDEVTEMVKEIGELVKEAQELMGIEQENEEEKEEDVAEKDTKEDDDGGERNSETSANIDAIESKTHIETGTQVEIEEEERVEKMKDEIVRLGMKMKESGNNVMAKVEEIQNVLSDKNSESGQPSDNGVDGTSASEPPVQDSAIDDAKDDQKETEIIEDMKDKMTASDEAEAKPHNTNNEKGQDIQTSATDNEEGNEPIAKETDNNQKDPDVPPVTVTNNKHKDKDATETNAVSKTWNDQNEAERPSSARKERTTGSGRRSKSSRHKERNNSQNSRIKSAPSGGRRSTPPSASRTLSAISKESNIFKQDSIGTELPNERASGKDGGKDERKIGTSKNHEESNVNESEENCKPQTASTISLRQIMVDRSVLLDCADVLEEIIREVEKSEEEIAMEILDRMISEIEMTDEEVVLRVIDGIIRKIETEEEITREVEERKRQYETMMKEVDEASQKQLIEIAQDMTVGMREYEDMAGVDEEMRGKIATEMVHSEVKEQKVETSQKANSEVREQHQTETMAGSKVEEHLIKPHKQITADAIIQEEQQNIATEIQAIAISQEELQVTANTDKELDVNMDTDETRDIASRCITEMKQMSSEDKCMDWINDVNAVPPSPSSGVSGTSNKELDKKDPTVSNRAPEEPKISNKEFKLFKKRPRSSNKEPKVSSTEHNIANSKDPRVTSKGRSNADNKEPSNANKTERRVASKEPSIANNKELGVSNKVPSIANNKEPSVAKKEPVLDNNNNSATRNDDDHELTELIQAMNEPDALEEMIKYIETSKEMKHVNEAAIDGIVPDKDPPDVGADPDVTKDHVQDSPETDRADYVVQRVSEAARERIATLTDEMTSAIRDYEANVLNEAMRRSSELKEPPKTPSYDRMSSPVDIQGMTNDMRVHENNMFDDAVHKTGVNVDGTKTASQKSKRRRVSQKLSGSKSNVYEQVLSKEITLMQEIQDETRRVMESRERKLKSEPVDSDSGKAERAKEKVVDKAANHAREKIAELTEQMTHAIRMYEAIEKIKAKRKQDGVRDHGKQSR